MSKQNLLPSGLKVDPILCPIGCLPDFRRFLMKSRHTTCCIPVLNLRKRRCPDKATVDERPETSPQKSATIPTARESTIVAKRKNKRYNRSINNCTYLLQSKRTIIVVSEHSTLKVANGTRNHRFLF